MPESNELTADVAAMRNQLDDIASMTEALLRVSGSTMNEEIMAYLRSTPVAREIFEACDGVRTQQDIVADLKAREVPGGSASMVTRALSKLVKDFHLLAKDHRKGKSTVYRKTQIAHALHIQRQLDRDRDRNGGPSV